MGVRPVDDWVVKSLLVISLFQWCFGFDDDMVFGFCLAGCGLVMYGFVGCQFSCFGFLLAERCGVNYVDIGALLW
jgi:hypothetical protein